MFGDYSAKIFGGPAWGGRGGSSSNDVSFNLDRWAPHEGFSREKSEIEEDVTPAANGGYNFSALMKCANKA